MVVGDTRRLLRLVLPTGEQRHVYLCGQVDCDDEGVPLRMNGTIADVSTGAQLQQEMRLERSRDPLTGLPNKEATLEWLDHLLLGRPYNANIAVISLDLDGFQEINDSLGSETGDQVLQRFALSLNSCSWPRTGCCRPKAPSPARRCPWRRRRWPRPGPSGPPDRRPDRCHASA